jgi:hypothetical protein
VWAFGGVHPAVVRLVCLQGLIIVVQLIAALFVSGGLLYAAIQGQFFAG